MTDALMDIICGSAAGALGKLIEYPFDTVKVRLQTSPSEMFPNTWSCIQSTFRNEGFFKGFYQGVGSPLVGAMMENAVLFLSYNQCYNYINNNYGTMSNNDNSNTFKISPILNTVISGSFAGSCASYVLTPVELVKCKLQVSNLQKDKGNPTTILATIKQVIRERGIKGLWKGQSSTFFREVLGGAVWFTTYEVSKQYFTKNKNKNDIKTWQLLSSGAAAGAAFNISTFPIDTIKSMVQIDFNLTITKAIKTILTEKGGIPGFYRGLGITIIRAVPANAVVFYTYELLSSKMIPKSTFVESAK
ncbi:related to Mitochondrial ornithine transporter 1 [Saccharomycodes ludwigii]|uniref:Related to Mitochondrial ornithine transporter 1 n=1 Tax=Saccharomycodes ludwigii TaxID=36035 RepID=A0A376B669_9ASCO|nr:hypothetical protein SCDLUD_003235 [Saccharomycodes ludwigii]KAH3900263.1 hypothetical protein SCDLUD_003235 [Saccharomycodes ludwigii]SSD59964.1 related to Mitochondrial ornithine transporter 1 [Saccharomycodes ludwigii]